MSTLNIIGEFLNNWESQVNFAVARELTIALAETAPRGHASALLIATDTLAPTISHVKANVAKIPLRSNMLPLMWRSNQAARPLDGEFLHALSPLAPLRTRDEDDGSQSSVMIPHSLAWDAPDILPNGQARQIRSFTRRALKHADVIVTPTHTVAERLREVYGNAIDPQVLPVAAPKEYLAGDNPQERQKELGLPETYVLTNAFAGEIGRLEWILRAYEERPQLPPLVIINQIGQFDKSTWPVLDDRITVINLERLSDMGAILQGATAFALPQQFSDCAYPVYGALTQGVPIVHGGNPCITEITLESSVGGSSEANFAEALLQVTDDADERERLSILARDRSRSFSWPQTAWQLWELHANI